MHDGPSAGKIIKELAPGVFKTLEKVKPSGALQIRRQVSGAVSFYWRYTIGSTSERVQVGIYDPLAPPKSLEPTARGYSVAAAVHAAQKMALEHHTHREAGGRPALLAAQRDSKAKAFEAQRRASENNLERLLTAYCDQLQALGRGAHKDARSIFKLHVVEPWPKTAELPANQVTSEHVADMMRRVLELGKGRTANKLRSYVRAAYQTARAARSKASIPLLFKAFNVTANPAADTEPDESQNKADKRPLSIEDLRAYWNIIRRLGGFRGAVLRLHLLTGGQRIEQLVNLQTENITSDAILLFDGKGRPGKAPRPHKVPLVTQATAALRECDPQSKYALSTDGGHTHLAATTLSAWAVEAAADVPDFQAKRVRSGVETLLASAGVSKEIRGRLQSHGIAGVQARHYDGHEYLAEKRKALEVLYKLLEQRGASKAGTITRK